MSTATSSKMDSVPPEKEDVSLKSSEKRKNRRGLGSKSKQAEAFRSKKNKGFDDDLVKKIENLKISFGYVPRELFGVRMCTSLIRPQIEFPVNTDSVGYLCQQIVELLHHACKIPSAQEAAEDEVVQFDIDTLMWVTALQIEAKMQFARTGTQFLPHLNRDVGNRVDRTELLLKRALTPLAVYVDQIGRFTVQEQIFVPSISGSHDFVFYCLSTLTNTCRNHFRCYKDNNPVGVRMPFQNHLGEYMRAVVNQDHLQQLIANGIALPDGSGFTPGFMATPANYQYFGLVDFVPEHIPPAQPAFSEIIRRYVEFEGRVSKKLSQAFVEIDISSGKGVESQLVFRRHLHDQQYAAWSPRNVRAEALEIGAILGLGHTCTFGNEGFASVGATIDTSAGLETLANILVKKLR